MVLHDSINKQENGCLIGEKSIIKFVALQCVNGAYYPIIDNKNYVWKYQSTTLIWNGIRDIQIWPTNTPG